MENCTKCGAPIWGDAKFCGACGAKAKDRRFCTDCGKEVKLNEYFCPLCGAMIESRRFCTDCGGELRSGENYCLQCGAPAKGIPAEDLPAPQAALQETDPSCFVVVDCAGGCRIKDYTGPLEGEVVVPASIGGKPVVEIGGKTFARCGNISSITVQGGVRKISGEAFLGAAKARGSVTIHAPARTPVWRYAIAFGIPIQVL